MKKLIIGLALALLLLILPLLVACGKSASSAPEPGNIGGVKPGYPPAPIVVGSGPDEGDSSQGGGNIVLPGGDERMIVRTGNLMLKVEDVLVSRDKISVLATGFGGYVVSTQLSGEAPDMRGYITIRIPGDRFEEALVEIRKLAVKVTSENTNSEDITEEYVDLQSRLTNAEATEKQYLDLLDKAQTVEEILKVYDALARVRGEIEQIKGRMQYIERTTEMALIAIYLEPAVSSRPVVESWNVLEVLKSAVRGIVSFAQVLLTIIIWLAIFSPVWGGILWLVLWQLRRRKKAKAQYVAPAPPESRPR